MNGIKKAFPVALLLAVFAVGGLSVVQTEASVKDQLVLAPQCNCRNPNLNNYGVLVPDEEEGGMKCAVEDTCWIPVN